MISSSVVAGAPVPAPATEVEPSPLVPLLASVASLMRFAKSLTAMANGSLGSRKRTLERT